MQFANLRSPTLDDYRARFVSHDLGETRQYIADAICPHSLSLLGRNQRLNARIGQTGFGAINFLYIQHGAAVSIDPGRLETVYLLQVPFGEADQQVEVNGSTIRLSDSMAYIVSPDQEVKMRFAERCGHVVMTVDRDCLCRHLEGLLQRPLDRQLVFNPEITCLPGSGHELISLILHLIRELKFTHSCFAQPKVRSQAVDLVLSTMLFGLGHNFTEELQFEAAIPRPRFVKWAQEYVRANAKEVLSPGEIARAACVSRRSLYVGFKSCLHCTPMAYVRDVKLNLIREELLMGDPIQDSVSRIALTYNVHHLSNFAANYKRKFGELPSRTLRCARPA